MGSHSVPRLCHIMKWGHFEGYGFNLLAEKTRPGQYIGKIDPDSPAEVAGLKEGDRIVEVNGVNVNQENHKQVVLRIKSLEQDTTLLVVDMECDQYYKEQGIIVKSTLPYVSHMSSEIENDKKGSNEEEVIHQMDQISLEEEKDCYSEYDKECTNHSVDLGNNIESNLKTQGSLSSGSNRSSPSPQLSLSSGKSNNTNILDSPKSEKEDILDPELNLNMSASEMRDKINSCKRRDPRMEKSGVSIAKKFEMIQAL